MVDIYTYNDLLDIGENEKQRMEFVLSAIRDHKGSALYKTAYDAELYYKHQNPTIMKYQKYVYDQMGRAVPDVWAANNKIASNWYNYFTVQAVNYLLGNGVSFDDDGTKGKLGKSFDADMIKLATAAKNGGISFGFWNYDHIDAFSITEFVPLWDEEDGGLKAGIRFWQIDDNKPLRATLYELDGYTDYIKRKDEDMQILAEKKKYIENTRTSEASGTEILDGENYPGFPIVPLWNAYRQSDLVGNRGTIDAYDLMTSGLINNVSEGEFIYWILQNCGGMDAVDDARFIEQLKLTHVAHADGDDGAKVDAHSVNVPFDASEAAINRLEKQLYKDFMGLNVQDISAGNVTATQIRAAYEPLNHKTDAFETEVTTFISGILSLAGIDDEPTYTRSVVVNAGEDIQNVLLAAEYLDDEYITKKILTILGDADKAEEVIKRLDAQAIDRYTQTTPEEE